MNQQPPIGMAMTLPIKIPFPTSAPMGQQQEQEFMTSTQKSLPLPPVVSVSSAMPMNDFSPSSPNQTPIAGDTAMSALEPRLAAANLCGSHLKFPFKLHHILSEAERLGFDHVIAWTAAGDGFRVYEPKTFARTVMPRFFGMSHYKSFQRQLSLYSFRRATEGINRG